MVIGGDYVGGLGRASAGTVEGVCDPQGTQLGFLLSVRGSSNQQ